MDRFGNENALYDKIINSVVTHLHAEGFLSVKANCKGHNPPARVKWDDEDEGVIPDITGEYSGSLYVFDIETGDGLDVKSAENRWRLLSTHAKRCKGKFYLVVPEPKAKRLQTIIEDLDVQPGFLKLRGVDNV